MVEPSTLAAIGKTFLAGVTAFGLTCFLTPLVRLTAVQYGWVAKPVEDRWGKRIIARLGGLAMFVGFMGSVFLWVRLDPTLVGLLVGVTLVFGLGVLDDLRRMPPYTKLVVQLLIGSFVVISGIRIPLTQWTWLSIPLTVLWFVLVMNAFNLLDNMDGLAAGIGTIAAAFYALHAGLAGQWTLATLATIVSGVCLGFLTYNFPPAKIFMGDSGSQLLGLSMAVLALMGSRGHSTQLLSVLVIPTLVLAVPIFDTCFVVIQRLLHRLHPFAGGTDHVSHRLAILGLSVRQTVIALYGISFCLGLLSIATVHLKPLPTIAIWLSVVTVLTLFGCYLAQVRVYRMGQHPIGITTLPSDSIPDLWRFEQGPMTPLDTMLMHKRRLLEVLIDFSLICSVYVFAYQLRFEGVLTGDLQQLIVQSLPLILAIKITCFAGCGLYRGVWRYLGLSDLITLVKAVTLGSTLSSLTLLYVWRFTGYSRAVLIIDWMLTFIAIGGSRVAERLFDEWIHTVAQQGVPVLIFGAGDTGVFVLRHLRHEAKPTRYVTAFLDDDTRKYGSCIYGCSVLGGRSKLSEAISRYHIREVLVAISDPPGELLRHIQQCCEPLGVNWKVVTAGVMNVL